MNLRQRQPRVHTETHLDFIRGLPCIICGNPIETEAAHIRFHDLRAAKEPTGIGRKPDDRWTLPLCGQDHRRQHSMNEREFWRTEGIDPIFCALALWAVSGDHYAGTIIVGNARHDH